MSLFSQLNFVCVFWNNFPAFRSDQESCSDNNAGCTHGCIQGPFGAQCTCPVGFQLSNDSKTCEDINECSPPGLCSQHCFNERGSFRCHCQDGYTLEADQRTCKASGIHRNVFNSLWMEDTTAPLVEKDVKRMYSQHCGEENRLIISPTVIWLLRR